MKRLSMNLGHVTNSSSMVYWFPREVLADPEIDAFIKAFELQAGWVGGDLSSRSGNHSFIVTRDQRLDAVAQFAEAGEYFGSRNYPKVDPDSEDVVVVYGDEYASTANQLAELLVAACKRNNLTYNSTDLY